MKIFDRYINQKQRTKNFFLFLFFLFSINAFAQQNTQRQLADQYLNNGEFDKAAAIYDKIYDQDTYGVYPNYLRALVSLKEFDKAEKMIKKMVKKNPDNLSYGADLGYLYSVQGDNSKARRELGYNPCPFREGWGKTLRHEMDLLDIK